MAKTWDEITEMAAAITSSSALTSAERAATRRVSVIYEAKITEAVPSGDYRSPRVIVSKSRNRFDFIALIPTGAKIEIYAPSGRKITHRQLSSFR